MGYVLLLEGWTITLTPFLTSFLTCWGPRGALLSHTDCVSLNNFGSFEGKNNFLVPSNCHNSLASRRIESYWSILQFLYHLNFCQWPQRQEASRPHPHHGEKELKCCCKLKLFCTFFLNLWRHWLELNWTKHGLKQLELSLICPKYKYSMEKTLVYSELSISYT